MSAELLDSAGRPRSPATLPGYRLGCPPRNKGRRYPAIRRALRGRAVQTGPRWAPRSPVRHFGGVSPAGGAG